MQSSGSGVSVQSGRSRPLDFPASLKDCVRVQPALSRAHGRGVFAQGPSRRRRRDGRLARPRDGSALAGGFLSEPCRVGSARCPTQPFEAVNARVPGAKTCNDEIESNRATTIPSSDSPSTCGLPAAAGASSMPSAIARIWRLFEPEQMRK